MDMEYSIWLFYDAIWRTQYGTNLRPFGVLHVINNVYCWKSTKCSTRLFFTTTWITLCGHYFMPYGVLHMVVFWCHMECFRIHLRGQILLPWYGVLYMAVLWCHMEYSIWLKSNAMWSTLCGNYFMSRGELHMVIFGVIWSALGFTKEVKFYCHMEGFTVLYYNIDCWRNTKYSTILIFTTPWSTPCGPYFMPNGVLHIVIFWSY